MTVEPTIGNDGSLVLTVMVDTLDRANVADFKERAGAAIEGSSGPVAVDCSRLEFIDSSGLGAFLYAHNLLPEDRRPIRLLSVGAKVLTILELMQVHRIFALEPAQ